MFLDVDEERVHCSEITMDVPHDRGITAESSTSMTRMGLSRGALDADAGKEDSTVMTKKTDSYSKPTSANLLCRIS